MLDYISRKHVHVIRSTHAPELHTLLDAINQSILLALHFSENRLASRPGDRTAALVRRRQRARPMDGGIAAKAAFDECCGGARQDSS